MVGTKWQSYHAHTIRLLSYHAPIYDFFFKGYFLKKLIIILNQVISGDRSMGQFKWI